MRQLSLLLYLIMASASASALAPALNLWAATPTKLPPSLLKAVWSGTPAGFETLSFHTAWRWHEELHELGPRAKIILDTVIKVPKDWEYKTARPRATRIAAMRKTAANDGAWALSAEQDVMDGGAELDFIDVKGAVHTLDVTLRSENRNPYILVSKTCDDVELKLEPGVDTARFLFLVVGCSVFGDENIFYFRRSPDARWVATPQIKNTKAFEFEYKFPIEPAAPVPAEGRRLFELRTEDPAGRRSEWIVVAKSEDY